MVAANWSLVLGAAVVAISSGCTAQLTSNTLDMQESYKVLLTKQILYNLGKAMDDSHFFPSQFLIGTGVAETSNAITPTLGVPLPASTITNAIAIGTATTATNTTATALGNATLGVSISDAWKYSWGVTARTDPDELRRLRALYLYATGRTPSVCNDTDIKATKDSEVALETRTIIGEAACFRSQYIMQGGRRSVNQAFTDLPGCVLCGNSSDQAKLDINPRLVFGFVSKTSKPGFHPYASYGFTKFYVRDDGGDEAFADFMLFVLEAMSMTTPISYVAPKPSPGTPGTPGTAAPARVPSPPKSQFMQSAPFSLPL